MGHLAQQCKSTSGPSYIAVLPLPLLLLHLPSAAGNIACSVTVENTGTVRLRGVQIQGPENNCSVIDVLWPKQNVSTCILQLAVSQTTLDAREADESSSSTELSIAVESVGRSNVTYNSTAAELVIPSPAATFTGLALPIIRNMSVTASIGKTSVNLTGRSALPIGPIVS